MTTLLAVAWSTAVAVAVLAGLQPWVPARRGRPSAVAAPGDGAAAVGGAPARHTGRSGGPRRVLHGLGAGAARAAALAVGRPPPAPAHPAALGAGLVLAALVAAVLPPLWPAAIVLAVLPPLWCRARRRRDTAAAGRAVLDELPEVIDLLGLAVAAGLTTPLAIAAVGRRGPGPLAAALGGAASVAADQNRRLPDVLDEVHAVLGAEGARPLLAALADSARHGTALGPSLDRLAAEARTTRRHRAEERARRVPILLLFPLVTCTLPALGLLTIAPLAVGALRDLRA